MIYGPIWVHTNFIRVHADPCGDLEVKKNEKLLDKVESIISDGDFSRLMPENGIPTKITTGCVAHNTKFGHTVKQCLHHRSTGTIFLSEAEMAQEFLKPGICGDNDIDK